MSLFKKYFLEFMRGPIRPYAERCPISVMETALRRRQYRDFVERFKAIFTTMREQRLMMFVGDDQKYFGQLFSLWFELLARPGFQFDAGDEDLFSVGGNIANILAVTDHKNGDECIKKVVTQDNNLAKLLLLYTPRSRLELPVRTFFDANPILTSLWYSSVWNWVDCYIHPVVQQNAKYFMEEFDDRFEPFDSNLICGYFRCTYVDNTRDVAFKVRLNRALAGYCSRTVVNNRPNRRSIALVSAFWDGQHAVYRAFAPYLEELAKAYDVSLVHIVRPDRTPNRDHFKRVYEVSASSESINIGNIVNNDFQFAYYPDVGMSQESMYLTNIRLAPIQAMGTGHPVSSASPYMDYFFSGAEVESGPESAANYSERLVLLPGLSVHPVKPSYRRQNPVVPAEPFLVNCPWMHMKINHDIVMLLKRIQETARRKILYQFFPGCGMTRNTSLMATMQDLATVLGVNNYIAHPDMVYDQYMLTQERGRFTLHSYPFGGGTTAVDALVLGKPLAVLEGKNEYNRYSAALLRRLGLDDLIATSHDAFVDLVVRLIDDEAYLDDATRRVREADLDARIFHVDNRDALRRAVDALIDGHEKFQSDGSREPIRV